MRYGLVRLLAVAMVATILGCGGSGTAVPSAAAPTQAPAAEPSAPGASGAGADGEPSAEASVAEAPSEAPPAASAESGGGNSGVAVGVCELVTPAELAGIFGVASVTTTVIPGPPDNCIVESEAGDGLTAWSLMTAQAGTVFAAMTSDPSTVALSGIGDKAAIVQNTGLLVLKGSQLLSVALTAAPDMSEDDVLEAARQIAAFAAGRL